MSNSMSVPVSLSPAPARKQDRAVIETRLENLCAGFDSGSQPLGHAMKEAVLAPGKRFRGVLMLAAADGTTTSQTTIVDAACAVELVHTASLIIDDLPAMDGAEERRGQRATHRAHGEGRAILAGIALVGEAMRLLATLPDATGDQRAEAVAVLSRAIGPAGLCAGQDLDLYATKTKDSLVQEQDLKTGVLFRAGFDLVGLFCGYDGETTQQFRQFALTLGRAFQCYDDLRDCLALPEQAGKTHGLDRRATGPDTGLLSVVDLDMAWQHYSDIRATLFEQARTLPVDQDWLQGFLANTLPDRSEQGGA